MKIDVKALALTAGLLWGFGLCAITWWIMIFDGATGEATMIGRVYRGYEISPVGSLVGLAWGFVDGAIGGPNFGWLYNRFSRAGRVARSADAM